MTALLLSALLLAGLAFGVWPGLDLWVASLFADETEFPLADSGELEYLRHLIWSGSILTGLGALVLWVIWRRLGEDANVPARLWGWVAALFLIGPGLLVNQILKEYWGRARPAHVFDGAADFTAWHVVSDQCARNCSFVSGEAAAAAAFAIALGALAWPFLGRMGRLRAGVALGLLAGVGGLLRVLTGRHFLSDVLMAEILVALVALALWRLMRVRPARDALSLPALRTDLRALAARSERAWRRRLG